MVSHVKYSKDSFLLMNKKKITVVEIYTDGACRGNPGPGGTTNPHCRSGPGGWGVVMQYQGHTKELFGGEMATTNNRMELMAAIMALESLKSSCKVDLNIDSQYVLKGITEWIFNWKKQNWRTAAK